MERLLRISSQCLMALSIVVLAGCSNFRLYSEERDKQGQAVKESHAKLDLTKEITIPRKNLENLLGEQLNLTDALYSAQAKSLARAMASGGTVTDKLVAPIERNLTKLVGGATPAETMDIANKWTQAVRDEAAAKSDLIKPGWIFARIGMEVPGCAVLKLDQASDEHKKVLKPLNDWRAANPGPNAEILRASIEKIIATCKSERFNATATVKVGGQISQTRKDLGDAEIILEEKRSKSLALRNEYRASSAAFENAVAEYTVQPNQTAEKVKDALKKVQSIVDGFDTLRDPFSVQFVAEEKKKSLDRLLAFLEDAPEGKPLPADMSRSARALALFPGVIDKARVALANAKKPYLEPLVLQKNLEQIKAEAAGRDVDLQIAKIALLREKLDWQTERVTAYQRASTALAAINPSLRNSDMPAALKPFAPDVTDVKSKKIAEDKLLLWKASAMYLDAQGRLQAEEDKVFYRMSGLQSQEALAYSESSIRQWDTLISTNANQLAEFGASGVKKENILALLNSLTLLWIAVGVNK